MSSGLVVRQSITARGKSDAGWPMGRQTLMICRARGLINVDLLHWLSRAGLLAPADGVIEDDNFLDGRDPFFEQCLDFSIIAISYSRVVGKLGLFGGSFEDVEAREVHVEGGDGGGVADVDNIALLMGAFKGSSVHIDFGPGLDSVTVGVDAGCRVNVVEDSDHAIFQ
ncbi:hypothetical protein HG530_010678 [Fusarium avenaceum]|nr:hypothetical protein HG530_010678 [Fusarium avenaceum]